MITEDEIKTIEEAIQELLQKMTVIFFAIKASVVENNSYKGVMEGTNQNKDFIDININIEEPQILIGQNGQTLFEFQHIVRMLLNKKLGKYFYVALDINEYKKKKIEYLKDVAKAAADEVAATKEKKILAPMPAYERRIIHAELAARQDVGTFLIESWCE